MRTRKRKYDDTTTPDSISSTPIAAGKKPARKKRKTKLDSATSGSIASATKRSDNPIRKNKNTTQRTEYLSEDSEFNDKLETEDNVRSVIYIEPNLTDLIESLDYLVANYRKRINLFSLWEAKNMENQKMYFYILDNSNELLRISHQIMVNRDMIVVVYVNQYKLTYNDLNWVLPSDLKLSRWVQLERLLSRYKDAYLKGIGKAISPNVYENYSVLIGQKKKKPAAKTEAQSKAISTSLSLRRKVIGNYAFWVFREGGERSLTYRGFLYCQFNLDPRWLCFYAQTKSCTGELRFIRRDKVLSVSKHTCFRNFNDSDVLIPLQTTIEWYYPRNYAMYRGCIYRRTYIFNRDQNIYKWKCVGKKKQVCQGIMTTKGDHAIAVSIHTCGHEEDDGEQLEDLSKDKQAVRKLDLKMFEAENKRPIKDTKKPLDSRNQVMTSTHILENYLLSTDCEKTLITYDSQEGTYSDLTLPIKEEPEEENVINETEIHIKEECSEDLDEFGEREHNFGANNEAETVLTTTDNQAVSVYMCKQEKDDFLKEKQDGKVEMEAKVVCTTDSKAVSTGTFEHDKGDGEENEDPRMIKTNVKPTVMENDDEAVLTIKDEKAVSIHTSKSEEGVGEGEEDFCKIETDVKHSLMGIDNLSSPLGKQNDFCEEEHNSKLDEEDILMIEDNQAISSYECKNYREGDDNFQALKSDIDNPITEINNSLSPLEKQDDKSDTNLDDFRKVKHDSKINEGLIHTFEHKKDNCDGNDDPGKVEINVEHSSMGSKDLLDPLEADRDFNDFREERDTKIDNKNESVTKNKETVAIYAYKPDDSKAIEDSSKIETAVKPSVKENQNHSNFINEENQTECDTNQLRGFAGEKYNMKGDNKVEAHPEILLQEKAYDSIYCDSFSRNKT